MGVKILSELGGNANFDVFWTQIKRTSYYSARVHSRFSLAICQKQTNHEVL